MRNFFIIILLLLSSCKIKPYEYENKITTHTDQFTNDTILTTNGVCTALGDSLESNFKFCTRYKIIKDKESFLQINKQTPDYNFESNFLRKIWLKIDGTDNLIEIDGPFELFIQDGDYIEGKVIKINKEIYSFLKLSLGRKVLIRFYNRKNYQDYSYMVSSDDSGQTKIFINNFDPRTLE